MKKSLSIKFKVLGALAVCMALAAVIFIMLAQRSYEGNVRSVAHQSIATAQKTFQCTQSAETSKLGATLAALMHDERMLELYVKRDRPGLLQYAQPLYAELKSRYAITNMHFMDVEPQMFIFLRLHDPENYNEVFWHQTALNAIQSQSVATGMELGKFGFALRVVAPYRDQQGKIIGYMEVAEDIARFTATMKAQTGDDYSLVAKKDLLDKEKYAISMQRKKLRDNWDDLASVVVLGATTEDQSLSRYDGDLTAIPAAGSFLQRIESDERVAVRGVFPLTDVSGKTIGGVFVRHDITPLYREMAATRMVAVATIVGLLVVLSGVLVALLTRLIFTRIERTMVVATRVVGGEFETQIVPASDDEVGRLETLLEGFRNVFVNTVNDYQQQLDGSRRVT